MRLQRKGEAGPRDHQADAAPARANRFRTQSQQERLDTYTGYLKRTQPQLERDPEHLTRRVDGHQP